MATLKLFDLLTSTDPSRVWLGKSLSEIELSWGEPESMSKTRRKHHYFDIWLYGDVELFFKGPKQQLGVISIKAHDWPPSGYSRLRIDCSGVSPFQDRDSFCEAMRQQGCDFSQNDSLVLDDDVTAVQSPFGAQVFFYKQAVSRRFLFHLRRAVELPEARPRLKQVAVSLPEPVYEKIRKLAVERRVSISRICSSWILENIDDLLDQ